MLSKKLVFAYPTSPVKRITLVTLFLCGIASLSVAKPTLRCDDYISYVVPFSGRCVKPEAFSKPGAPNQKIKDLNRQISPLITQNVRMTGGNKGPNFIEGEVYNQSRRTIKYGARVTVDINGFAEEVPIYGSILPGQKRPFKWLSNQQGRVTVIDVSPLE